MKTHKLFFLISIVIISNVFAQPTNKNNFFNHNLGRLFSVQTGDVNRLLDLSLLVGGSFGLENSEGFLGSAIFGLGGYGDVEISTASLLGSVFSKTENFASIGLKVKVLSEINELPAIAFTLKTNNDWYRSNNPDLKEKLPEVASYGLRSISYDTRITHLIVSFSKKTSDKSRMHLALGLGDLRYKNLKSYFVDSFFIDESTKMKNTF